MTSAGHRRRGAGIAAALVAAVLTVGGCRHATEPRDAADETAAAPPPAEAPGRVTLGADEVARAGIATVAAAAAETTPEVDAFARVLDPLPLVQDLHAREAARTAESVAHAEAERVARLQRDDQNASARDLEAARATLATATAVLADANARLALAWGAAAEQSAAFADDLVGGRAALVRIDLPPGARLAAPPPTVSVAAVADPSERAVARVLGRAPTTDPALQGEAFLALLTNAALRPGTTLTATVRSDVAPAVGVAVPASAVVWVDALPAVYVEPADGTFERRPVTLGPRLGERWLVTAGVAAGDRVVSAGAARLLSAEVLAAAPAED